MSSLYPDSLFQDLFEGGFDVFEDSDFRISLAVLESAWARSSSSLEHHKAHRTLSLDFRLALAILFGCEACTRLSRNPLWWITRNKVRITFSRRTLLQSSCV